MAETARPTSVANKALADQLLPGKTAGKSAEKAAPASDEAPAASSAPSRVQRIRAWAAQQPSRGVLLVLLGTSLVANGLALVQFRGRAHAAALTRPASEVDLGSFVFRTPDPTQATLQEVHFSLALSLLDGVDRATRENLERHPRRVRQAVEELLRTANNDDFDDPTLLGIKRRLQEQVNGALGIRGIAEVIITDLVTTPAPPRGTIREGVADVASRSPAAAAP